MVCSDKLFVAKLLKFGNQPVSIEGGVRYSATSPDDVGPTGWGGRLKITFLFPAGRIAGLRPTLPPLRRGCSSSS